MSRLRSISGPLLATLPLALGSFALRFLRWRLLLERSGHPIALSSFSAYLAGFAFTASPGKAGELIRIRYFLRQGVPAARTISAFVFERACDLAVVLGLAAVVAVLVPAFALLAVVIAAILAAIVLCARAPLVLRLLRRGIHVRAPGHWIARAAAALLDGLAGVRPLLAWQTVRPSLGLGALAWLLPSIAFGVLCKALGISLPWWTLIGLYPAAMLIGALSFVPGGLGTTEAAIVVLLGTLGIDFPDAITVAIAIRLATLWVSIVLGMACLAWLELRPALANR
ncbi:lysylphosphatidylglycerol synthase transmembrane domain-containing protein [Luteimonas huabeiensis]|uniref:lysylphosphatidylglycerol synthase transmembrane domain-containing protein n=1 Tax=Luteimonas huabeiensis TaxID=1244513 RepID=UPI000693800E